LVSANPPARRIGATNVRIAYRVETARCVATILMATVVAIALRSIIGLFRPAGAWRYLRSG
jgi:hypothetical protein